ncbi:unnamed protein product [Leptosia nina]|uniref:Uncharacterized protein n=1 Tax=Leptosia nina TaxID=320188 RepID=A0AAV1JQU9_9NEOP
MTGPSDESSTFGPARRLDDSIFESNEKNNFEGALMKLTMKPPALKTSTTYPEVDVNSMVKKLPPDYLMFDKMKAIQVAVDKQKAAEAERRMTSREQPAVPEDSGRRMMPKVNFPSTTSTTQINSLRLAVPDPHFHAPGGWQEPKNSASKFGPFGDYPGHWTLPSPVTTAGPIRPTRRSTYRNAKPPSLTPPRTSIESFQTPPQDFKNDFEDINKRLLFDKFDDPSLREEEMEHKMKKRPNQSEEDYEEEIKGIPIRKKRNLEDTTVYPHKIDQTINVKQQANSGDDGEGHAQRELDGNILACVRPVHSDGRCLCLSRSTQRYLFHGALVLSRTIAAISLLLLRSTAFWG